ncbi:hypothetical protein BKA00_003976 [Actinomadura coerulea]|uniref:Uncharacterized protein n=1 Tax=Actinomadura coerulea TaxID=46159 RepID=A0A7X0G0C2_9ACTN|nr:hypothetical protein [Actinomadura coerulea]MBB6397062.1 hypothetical protein [Actinomadura coerulea]GGP96337.1 hypothetical protein GCM10010187_10050 [Actinomadura coerulea]
MNDSFETHVFGAPGSFHAGNGDINNIITLPSTLGTSPRKKPADELWWLRRRFVEPAGLAEAREILEASHTVFIDGTPGSGRVAAAQILLQGLQDDAGQLHQLVPQEEENAPRIDRTHVGDGELVWLDLSALTGTRWEEVHAELSSLRATVQKRDAYLAVILPDKAAPLDPTLAPYRARIERPAVAEVLVRYLQVEKIDRPTPLPPLRFLATARRMEDIPAYVDLIRRARDEHREGDFTMWSEAAFTAWSGQAQDVAEQMAALITGQERALLITVAMLHEAHADVVHRASAALLDRAEHPPEDLPLLEHAFLDKRLHEIGARLDDCGTVQFAKLDYDAAVRSYFWTHMPGLHDTLRDWVVSTVDSPDLSPLERKNLVERFTAQCLLHERYGQVLASLLNQLTALPTTGRKMEAAAQVLQRGLRDEKQGRFFRRQIYNWSRISNLSSQIAELIIAACRDEMMVKYPAEALVRLHHLARRETGTRARDTLVALVNDAPRLRRQMLARLTEATFEPGKFSSDVTLFMELADPEALTALGRRNYALVAEKTIRRQLTYGWSLVFAQLPYGKWTPFVRRWLTVAVEDDHHRDTLIDIIVHAASGDVILLSRFYEMTRTTPSLIPLSTLISQRFGTFSHSQ